MFFPWLHSGNSAYVKSQLQAKTVLFSLHPDGITTLLCAAEIKAPELADDEEIAFFMAGAFETGDATYMVGL
ncbi:hypothetical protein [Nitrosomonas sp.]|uniref:hypothetical protein n=1 Tax=Nitrosomonas sp. TaxID=42353 RepID=UPI0025E27105|nr:hypothetical protein [Nitrosomonas sp.]